MRRYCSARQEIAFFLPARIDKWEVRARVAEGIIFGALRFLDPYGPGGPIAQHVKGNRLTEIQIFPTRYPQLVIERTDQYKKPDGQSMHVEWKVVRLQNQRKSTLVDQALQAGSLAIEIAKFLPVL